jgi:hypothetical protein
VRRPMLRSSASRCCGHDDCLGHVRRSPSSPSGSHAAPYQDLGVDAVGVHSLDLLFVMGFGEDPEAAHRSRSAFRPADLAAVSSDGFFPFTSSAVGW